MRRLLVFLSVALLACSAQAALHCFAGEYAWAPIGARGAWFVDLDVAAGTPVLLQLADIRLAPAVAPCSGHDAVVLGWDSLPFAQLPVPCKDDEDLLFGVGSHAPDVWGTEPLTPRDGRIVAPQGARVDMASGVANAHGEPSRTRRLLLTMASGASRVPVAPLTVQTCVVGPDAPQVDAYVLAASTLPRIVPIAECVREFGGHCGVNVGWINSAGAPIELPAHTDANRVHPPGVENGWTLPSVFAAGTHAPASLSPHMHFGWACDVGLVGGVEAKWHLDGWTLHLDALAQRCADPDAPPPGKTFVWDAADRMGLDSYKDGGDARIGVGLAVQTEVPHVAATPHDAAVEAWKKSGEKSPYMSTVAAESHAAANVEALSHRTRRSAPLGRRSDCECWDECTDCADAWWVLPVVLGVFLLFILCLGIALWWWAEPELHAPSSPSPRPVRIYESDADYHARTGTRAPVHLRDY